MRDSTTFITCAFCLCLLDYDDASITAMFTAFFHAWGMQLLRVVSRCLISHTLLICLTRAKSSQ